MQQVGQIIQSGATMTLTAQSYRASVSIGSTDTDMSKSPIFTMFSSADFTQACACCTDCGTPIQMDIEILGVLRRVPITCQCRHEAYERDRKTAEQNDLRRRLERFKAYSLMDNRFEASTFENWVHRPDNRDDIIDRIQMHIPYVSKDTYYRHRKRAVRTFSSVLWGFTTKSEIGTLDAYPAFAYFYRYCVLVYCFTFCFTKSYCLHRKKVRRNHRGCHR